MSGPGRKPAAAGESAPRAARAPLARAAGPWAGLGLGLPMVDAIAAEWGVERIADGKIVWAELTLPYTHAAPTAAVVSSTTHA